MKHTDASKLDDLSHLELVERLEELKITARNLIPEPTNNTL